MNKANYTRLKAHVNYTRLKAHVDKTNYTRLKAHVNKSNYTRLKAHVDKTNYTRLKAHVNYTRLKAWLKRKHCCGNIVSPYVSRVAKREGSMKNVLLLGWLNQETSFRKQNETHAHSLMSFG